MEYFQYAPILEFMTAGKRQRREAETKWSSDAHFSDKLCTGCEQILTNEECAEYGDQCFICYHDDFQSDSWPSARDLG
jgi:hypothetical protein